eukprot:9415051-Pyramimonas_sp.AAC.2
MSSLNSTFCSGAAGVAAGWVRPICLAKVAAAALFASSARARMSDVSRSLASAFSKFSRALRTP